MGSNVLSPHTFGSGFRFFELAKSSQPTLESSSIQTTEQIVKFHTILEMGSHDLSPHTFRSGLQFFKGLQKGFFKLVLDLFSAKGVSNWMQ